MESINRVSRKMQQAMDAILVRKEYDMETFQRLKRRKAECKVQQGKESAILRHDALVVECHFSDRVFYSAHSRVWNSPLT